MTENVKRWLWGIGLAVVGYFVFPFFLPFLIALLLAVLIEPVVQQLQRLGMNRSSAVWMTMGFIGLGTLVGLYFAITRIVVQLTELYYRFPSYMAEIEERFFTWYNAIPQETLEAIRENLSGGVSNWMSGSGAVLGRSASAFVNFASAIPGALILSIFTAIAFVLFSFKLPWLKESFYDWFHPESHKKLDIIFHELNRGVIGFLRGQLLLSFFIFILTSVGLLLLRTPYALGLATLITFIDFIPFMGAGLVMIPWILWVFFLGNNTFLGVGLVILYIAVTLVRRVGEPMVLGDTMGMSTITILISMFLGFSVMGLLGIFVGPGVVVFIKGLRKAGFLQFRIRI